MSTTLVFYGFTMNGAPCSGISTTRRGPSRFRFKLVASDGGYAMSYADAMAVVHFVSGANADKGKDAMAWFADGKFWDFHQHSDRIDSTTDEDSGEIL